MASEENVVRITQWPESQAQVKLCVSVCEPICAQSEYTIGIDIFDRPVASITVLGTTKLYNCPEKTTTVK